LGAQWTGITTGGGASVPMLASLVKEAVLETPITRTQALSFKAESA
jgi:hypothetical protein